MLVVCLGGGPSLSRADVEACRHCLTIAINNSIDLAPWADVCFAADFSWWDARRGLPYYRGLRVGMEPWSSNAYPAVRRFLNAGPTGLSRDPERLCTGQNSGYAAINLAVLMGATAILLLGYDMQPAADGTHHWHPAHPGDRHPNYRRCIAAFDTLKEPLTQLGVQVYNCNPSSQVICFPRMTLEAALSKLGDQSEVSRGATLSATTGESPV